MICRGRNCFATAWQKDRILANSTMRCSLTRQQRIGEQISARLSLRCDSVHFIPNPQLKPRMTRMAGINKHLSGNVAPPAGSKTRSCFCFHDFGWRP